MDYHQQFMRGMSSGTSIYYMTAPGDEPGLEGLAQDVLIHRPTIHSTPKVLTEITQTQNPRGRVNYNPYETREFENCDVIGSPEEFLQDSSIKWTASYDQTSIPVSAGNLALENIAQNQYAHFHHSLSENAGVPNPQILTHNERDNVQSDHFMDQYMESSIENQSKTLRDATDDFYNIESLPDIPESPEKLVSLLSDESNLRMLRELVGDDPDINITNYLSVPKQTNEKCKLFGGGEIANISCEMDPNYMIPKVVRDLVEGAKLLEYANTKAEVVGIFIPANQPQTEEKCFFELTQPGTSSTTVPSTVVEANRKQTQEEDTAVSEAQPKRGRGRPRKQSSLNASTIEKVDKKQVLDYPEVLGERNSKIRCADSIKRIAKEINQSEAEIDESLETASRKRRLSTCSASTTSSSSSSSSQEEDEENKKKRNNEASKRSRDKKKQEELEKEMELKLLEKQNQKLKDQEKKLKATRALVESTVYKLATLSRT